VFFLPETLQVDLAFVPSVEFRPLGPTFRLVSGRANPLQPLAVPEPKYFIGMGWLYALHARSCILRRKPWQAEYMISAVRDHALTLVCMRLGLPSAHGRGMDLVPDSIKKRLSGSFVQRLEPDELWCALDVAIRGLLDEIHRADEDFAARIHGDILQVSRQPSESPEPGWIQFLGHTVTSETRAVHDGERKVHPSRLARQAAP